MVGDIAATVERICGSDANDDDAFGGWVRLERRGTDWHVRLDPVGQASVYWTRIGSVLAVASRLRLLVDLPGFDATIDGDVLAQRITGFNSSDTQTVYRSVRTLGSGTQLTVEGASLATRVQPWHTWDVPLVKESEIEDVKRDLGNRLPLVMEHICNDVGAESVGVALSGGLDSSVLVGAAAKCDMPVSALTIRYPGLPCDESRFQDSMLRRTGCVELTTTHREFDPIADLVGPTTRGKLPLPRTEPEAWDLYRKASNIGISTVITGIGGDELFGAYWHGSIELLLARSPLRRTVSQNRQLLRAAVKPLVKAAAPRSLVQRHYGRVGRKLLTPEFARTHSFAAAIAKDQRALTSSQIQRMRIADTFSRGASQMHREGRALAADEAGVAMVHPFLDPTIVRLALSVPNRLLVTDDDARWLQRTAFAAFLSDELLTRRGKVHFDYRHAANLGHRFFDDLFASSELVRSGVVDHDRLIARHQCLQDEVQSDISSISPLASDLWRVAGAELWFRQNDGRVI